MRKKPDINLYFQEKLLLTCIRNDRFAIYQLIKLMIATLPLLIIILLFSINFLKIFNIDANVFYYAVSGFFLIIFIIYYLLSSYINKAYCYFFTDQRCVICFDFFIHDQKIVLYDRIFSLEIKQNLLESCLGIASIYINTQNPCFLCLTGLLKSQAEHIIAIINPKQ